MSRRRKNRYAVAYGFSPVQATAGGSGYHGPRRRNRAERRSVRDFLYDELTEYETDREETPMLNNDDRADYGRAGLMAGDPDHDSNDTRTSAGDAIANILHCAVREQAGWEATAWKQEHPDGPEFSREAWAQSDDCRAYVEGIIDSAKSHLFAELSGVEF